MGEDTEMIGYHATPEYLIDSDGNVCKEAPFLDWLLQNGDTKVCYDLDAFAACLFRLIELTKEEAVLLSGKEKLWADNYSITYFPGRYLGIAKGRGTNRPYVSFSDMSRYIEQVTHNPGESPFEKAKLAQQTAIQIGASLKEIGGGVNAEAVGSITQAVKPVLKHVNSPTHLDYPVDVVQAALQNIKGNWVEAFKIGYIPMAYDLDMSGAYASFLATLPDTRWGVWVNSKQIPTDAVIGFASGTLTRRSNFSPFLYRSRDSLHGVIGSWPDVLNLAELRFLEKHKGDSFEIDKGWWWIPNGDMRYPYRGAVNWMWQKRQESSGMTKDLIKRMMAYMWGQTLADYGAEFGQWYNPVYGALVERGCAVKVADFVLSNGLEDNLCHIAVDGAMFDCPVSLDKQSGLGAWRESYTAPAIIVNSGYVFVQGKAGLQEFAHNYEWLKSMLDENPEAESYERGKYTVAGLSQCVLQDRLEDLGTTQWVTDTIRIGQETKRFYLNSPKNGWELMSGLYSSKPLNIDLVRAMGG